MVDGKRLLARMQALGISQSELARRAGLAQQTIHKLINGTSRNSAYLHRIARALSTTPAYLTGEIDDPDENAPPPFPVPLVQSFMLPVMLPSEDALTEACLGLLMASRRLNEGELARELARRLPLMLRVAGDNIAFSQRAAPPEPVSSDADPDDARPATRQAYGR